MALPTQFYDTLKTRSVEEIIYSLRNYRDYQPEAIELFKSELKSRGVPVPEFDSKEADQRELEYEKRAEKSDAPLEWYMRAIFCFVGVGPVVAILLYSVYRRDGYVRKARESIVFAVLGLILVTFLRLYLNRNNVSIPAYIDPH